VSHWYGGVWNGWRLIVLIIAILMDLSPARGRRRNE
jgi:hypothetical protein